MKKAAKLLALFTIIALLVVSVAACAGPQGATGPAGPQGPKGDKGDTGPAGPQGPAGVGTTAEIVVCYWDGASYRPTCQVYFEDVWYILGACFPPGEEVTITICDKNCVLAQANGNDCGAFLASARISELPHDQMEYLFDKYEWDFVSVRAWVNAEVVDGKVVSGEEWANWPLTITWSP